MSAIDETPSPKQLARRALIVQAAVDTLRRDGITGCTVRAIADATPFTKGTIHYYFDDVREIINTAYLRLTADYVRSVDVVAGEAGGPVGAFWRALASYAEGFRGHRRMGVLWFEYSTWAVRNGYDHGVEQSVEAIRSMFARRLDSLDPPVGDSAGPLTRYLLGTVLELSIATVEAGVVLGDGARICALRPPRRDQIPREHGEICPICRSGDEVAFQIG